MSRIPDIFLSRPRQRVIFTKFPKPRKVSVFPLSSMTRWGTVRGCSHGVRVVGDWQPSLCLGAGGRGRGGSWRPSVSYGNEIPLIEGKTRRLQVSRGTRKQFSVFSVLLPRPGLQQCGRSGTFSCGSGSRLSCCCGSGSNFF